MAQEKRKKKKEGNPGYDTVKTPPTDMDIGKKNESIVSHSRKVEQMNIE